MYSNWPLDERNLPVRPKKILDTRTAGYLALKTANKLRLGGKLSICQIKHDITLGVVVRSVAASRQRTA